MFEVKKSANEFHDHNFMTKGKANSKQWAIRNQTTITIQWLQLQQVLLSLVFLTKCYKKIKSFNLTRAPQKVSD